MSLTSRINGSSAEDKALQDILRSTMPPKSLFATVSGTVVFSPSQYVAAAPYTLPRRGYAGVVGTAFDYLARAVVARTIDEGKDACFKLLVAEQGLSIAVREGAAFGSRPVKDVAATYDRAITTLANYAYHSGGATLEAAIESTCKLARFDYIARNSRLAADPFMLAGAFKWITETEPDAITHDLERLADVFARVFVISGIVRSDSAVIFNPKFAALQIGGADADIMIDSVLYDFKTGKTPGYKWQDVAQLWGYYLLGEIGGIHDAVSFAGDEAVSERHIRRLALYRARFGEIEHVDVDELDTRQTLTALQQLREYLGMPSES